MKDALLLSLLFIAALPATAHRVTVDALFEDGVVYVECWEGRSDPAASGKLTVKNATGEVLHTAELDEDGFYEYRPKRAEELTFSVKTGPGHKGEATLDLTGQSLESQGGQTAEDTPAEEATAAAPGANKRPSLRANRTELPEPVRILLGLLCVAVLYAVYTSYRNQQRLRAIEEELRARELDSR